MRHPDLMRFVAHAAGVVLLLGGALSGCDNPMAFRFLGTAHYDGQVFQSLEGQFENLALSPTGGRVAFRGRDDREAFVLFAGDVDGRVRRIAATGPSDGLISWSADGGTLYYLDMVARPDGLYDGATIQQHSLASGLTRQALYAVPLIPFFASPDGSRLLVAGASNLDRLPLALARNQMLEMSDGTRRAVAPNQRPVWGDWAAVWAPDGQHLALASPTTDSSEGPVTLALLAAPDWSVSRGLVSPLSWHYSAMAWEDASVLRVVEIRIGDEVAITRLDTDGRVLAESSVALDSPPPDRRYRYERPLLSRDGRRILLTRQASNIETGMPIGMREQFVIDQGGLRPVPVSQDLSPVGWIDARRVLFTSGFYQRKRPVVLTIEEGATP